MSESISFVLTEADLAAGYRLVSQWSRKTWLNFLAHTAALSLIGVFVLYSDQLPPSIRPFGKVIFWTLAVGWSIQGALHVLMNSRLWRSRFKQRIGHYTVSWDEACVAQTSPIRAAKIPWSHIRGWRQNDRFLVLFHGRTYTLIPKDRMSEDSLHAFTKFLSAKAGAQQCAASDPRKKRAVG